MLGPAVHLGVCEIRSTPVGEAISAKGRCFGCVHWQFFDFLSAISAQVRQKVVGATVRIGTKIAVRRIAFCRVRFTSPVAEMNKKISPKCRESAPNWSCRDSSRCFIIL